MLSRRRTADAATVTLGFGAVLLGALAWISTLILTRKRHPGGCDERNGQR